MEDFLTTDSKAWADIALTGPKQDLVGLYRKYNIRLSLQNRLEDKLQSSTILQDKNHTIIICRYPYTENGLSPQLDTMAFIFEGSRVITLHRNPLICNSLRKLTAGLPAEELNGPRIFVLALEKILEQAGAVVALLEEDLSKALEDYREAEYLPTDTELLQLTTLHQEATIALNQLHWLISQIPQAFREELRDNSRRDLQAALNYSMALINRLSCVKTSLAWLEATGQKSLMTKNTTAINRLGTLCSIFLPIIFIATLYGMRFENMSELKSAWGYPLSLGLMALTALVAWWYNKH